MPRKKRSSLKRDINGDPKFQDKDVAMLINKIMWEGKKGVAEKIVYGAFDVLKEKKGEDPVGLFKKAMDAIRPAMEVRSRRVGGANYQVPMEVRPARRTSLGLRWLVQGARGRGEKSMKLKLANEIMEALENRGSAIKKREETHRMAEANKVFAHYNW